MCLCDSNMLKVSAKGLQQGHLEHARPVFPGVHVCAPWSRSPGVGVWGLERDHTPLSKSHGISREPKQSKQS